MIDLSPVLHSFGIFRLVATTHVSHTLLEHPHGTHRQAVRVFGVSASHARVDIFAARPGLRC